MRIVLYLALTSNGPPRIKLTLKPNISTISVNSARKPEGVGVRGQGKVAFSHALWLPLPRGAEHVAYKGRAASRLIGNSVWREEWLLYSEVTVLTIIVS